MNKERREKAIAWIKEEIQSLERAPELNGCPMTPEWAAQLEIMRTCLEAVQDSAKMVPLTLEQLRKMDGQPVWVERNEEPYDGKWFIVDHADVENPDRTLYTKEGVTYSDYGVYFTAYAYPPAHIDRDACNPCMMCKNQKSLNLSLDMNCRYCPKCGRPLTEEAWAELEKRLRGVSNV